MQPGWRRKRYVETGDPGPVAKIGWIVLVCLMMWPAPPAMAQEPSEAHPQYLDLRAGLGVGLQYVIPTVAEERDARFQTMNSVNAYIRAGYFTIIADLAPRTAAWISLGARRTAEAELADQEDPNASRLVLGLQATGLHTEPLSWFGFEAGIIDTPWNQVSSNAWAANFVSSAPARRYGLVQTSDLGIDVFGEIPLSSFPIDYKAAFTNGESEPTAENERYKGIQGAITFFPLPFSRYTTPLRTSLGYGYRAINDPPGPQRNNEHFLGLLFDYDAQIFTIGLETDLLIRRRMTNEAPAPFGLASLYFIYNPDPDWQVFIRGDARDNDLRNSSKYESSLKSLRFDRYLRADQDGRLTVLSGFIVQFVSPIQVAPYLEAVFYQEPGPDGDLLAPTVTTNLAAFFRF